MNRHDWLGPGTRHHIATVYKITLDDKTTYAYVGVSTQKGLTTPVIDGKANYVTMGISR